MTMTFQVIVLESGGWWPLCPYVGVSVPEHLVQHVAVLPADHGAAGQRQVLAVGHEGGGATLLVCAQDDVFTRVVKETPCTTS